MANASRPGGAGVRELAPKKSRGKTLLKWGLVLVLLVLGAYWGWGKHAAARLEREVARYRAAGEPIDPSDFLEPRPPDETNAAVDLIAAGKLIDERSKAWRRFTRLSPALPLDDKEIVVIGDLLNASSEALQRLDAAMTKPRVYWRQTYQSPVVRSDPIPHYELGALVSVLRAAALRSHQRGDDRDALLRIRQILFIARAIDRDPSLASHGAAERAACDACDAIVDIAPDLVADSQATTVDVRGLISDLTDDAADRAALVRALQGERMRSCDFIRAYAAGHSELASPGYVVDFEARARRVFMAPLVLNDGPIVLAHISRLIDTARTASDWPEMRASLPDLDRPAEVTESPSLHCMTCLSMRRFESAIKGHFRTLATKRLAASVLAIRLYASEHGGRNPADLGQLVPSYLKTLPVDPMAQGGRRLHFVVGQVGAMLYSVGDNETDELGDDWSVHVKPYPIPSGLDWCTPDFVAHLTRQPRIRFEDDE